MVDMVRFRIEGLAELERAMKELGQRAATSIADRGLTAGAGVIVADAKRRVPVRTGALKRSITSLKGKAERGSRRRTIGFRRPVSRRAHFTEFGTAHSAAQPFMRPALDTMAGKALLKMAEIMASEIEREALGLRRRNVR